MRDILSRLRMAMRRGDGLMLKSADVPTLVSALEDVRDTDDCGGDDSQALEWVGDVLSECASAEFAVGEMTGDTYRRFEVADHGSGVRASVTIRLIDDGENSGGISVLN